MCTKGSRNCPVVGARLYLPVSSILPSFCTSPSPPVAWTQLLYAGLQVRFLMEFDLWPQVCATLYAGILPYRAPHAKVPTLVGACVLCATTFFPSAHFLHVGHYSLGDNGTLYRCRAYETS